VLQADAATALTASTLFKAGRLSDEVPSGAYNTINRTSQICVPASHDCFIEKRVRESATPTEIFQRTSVGTSSRTLWRWRI